MTSNRIENAFREQHDGSTIRVLPYFTCGFPDVQTTAKLVRCADGLGATAIEIGVPYSDSIADGPVIQESFNDVLKRGQKLVDVFRLVEQVRPHVTCGLIAMVSYSLLHRFDVNSFMRAGAAAGFDGVIVPDLPIEESPTTFEAAESAGLCHIGLVAPSTAPERRNAIAKASTGFVYQIAVAGTTGERQGSVRRLLAAEIKQLRAAGGVPVCVGFGISTPQQVRDVCRIADGAIVGSAIIRRIRECLNHGITGDMLVARVSDFLSDLLGR